MSIDVRLLPGERVQNIETPPIVPPRQRPGALEALMQLTGVSRPEDIGKNGPSVAARSTHENEGIAELRRFEVLFGRDSLRVALDVAADFPLLLRATILALATLQGVTFYAPREEEPGRIIHEYRDPRTDTIAQQLTAQLGWEWPFYASVDATVTYINAIARYCDETPEGLALLEATYAGRDGREHTVRHSLDQAVGWLTRRLDSSPDGFLEFSPRFKGSIENQVWKDSWDSYHHADGTLADHGQGVVSIEMQALAYDALAGAASLYRRLAPAVDQSGAGAHADPVGGHGTDAHPEGMDASGADSHAEGVATSGADSHAEGVATSGTDAQAGDMAGRSADSYAGRAAQLDERARLIRQQVMRWLWVEDAGGGYFALGADRSPDGRLRPLRIRTSNMGHALNSRLLEHDDEETAARREALIRTLFAPRMLNASGIRTLASDELRFRPGAYHNGSVWLWDTYYIAQGLERHGYAGLAWALNNRIMAAIDRFGKYPEFARGDDGPEPRLNERIVDLWDETHQRINRVEQPPQEIQAWTVAAAVAIERERIQRGSGDPMQAVDERKKALEEEILSSLSPP